MNYNIIGEPFPAVVCTLNADESMITERGSMCWMSPNMKMETTSNGGHRQSFRQDVFRRVYVPKSLHGRRRHGHHRIRVKLPRLGTLL